MSGAKFIEILYNLPSHVRPFALRINPGLHRQKKRPLLPWGSHKCSQPPLLSSHIFEATRTHVVREKYCNKPHEPEHTYEDKSFRRYEAGNCRYKHIDIHHRYFHTPERSRHCGLSIRYHLKVQDSLT